MPGLQTPPEPVHVEPSVRLWSCFEPLSLKEALPALSMHQKTKRLKSVPRRLQPEISHFSVNIPLAHCLDVLQSIFRIMTDSTRAGLVAKRFQCVTRAPPQLCSAVCLERRWS